MDQSLAATEQALIKMIETVGTPDLSRFAIEAINGIVDVERLHVFEHGGPSETRRLHCAWSHRTDLEHLNGVYAGRFFKVDPIYSALNSADPGENSVMLRLNTGTLEDSDYRRACFERFSITERVSIAQKIRGRWLTLNVAARGRSFTDIEVGALYRLCRLALPLIARHSAIFRDDLAAPMSTQELEDRFAAGFPQLTLRERQVCARSVIGMTAEATAIDLGVGISTVLTYRRRAYERLNISSTYQLSMLVMR